MADRQSIEAFLQGPGPVVDVRAPAEFEKGRIPGAQNLPLFSDQERAEVGTSYKQQGRTAAVQLGLSLVGPKLAFLGEKLQTLSRSHPGQPLKIHCWRGGMRSGSIAWLAETLDLEVVLLEGGYKSYRQWVLALMEQPWPIRLLGGRTGTGKTDLLMALAEVPGSAHQQAAAVSCLRRAAADRAGSGRAAGHWCGGELRRGVPPGGGLFRRRHG